MDQFPPEVLNQIFILLHQYDKVECMLVCRYWANVMEHYNLFNEIQCSKWTTFIKLMDRLQHEPFRGSQTENLILRLGYDKSIVYNTVLRLFPNLKNVYLSINQQAEILKEEEVAAAMTQELKKKIKIEYIEDSSDSSFTFHILSSFQCNHLKTLHVSAQETNIPGKEIIDLLSNCPNLEHLNMGEYSLSLDDLEVLHLNLPLLQVLRLPRTRLLPGTYPFKMKPATSITIFSITTVNRMLEKEINWLRYISIKYSKLIEFGYRNISIRNHVEVSRIEREGLLPLFYGLGRQLKTLAINVRDYGPSIFKTLEETAYKGESLDFGGPVPIQVFDSFSHFSRVKYIQHLKIMVKGIRNFEWLRELISLKKLELIFSFAITSLGKVLKETVQLNQLLDICADTLESLTIGGVHVNIDASTTRRLYSINYLELFSVSLPKYTMDHFISSALLNLKTLILQDCALNGVKFSLPNHHLSYVFISEGEYFRDKYSLLITNKEKRWLTAKGNIYNKYQSVIHRYPEYPSFPPPASLPFDALNEIPVMTFVCASVNKFMILHPYN